METLFAFCAGCSWRCVCFSIGVGMGIAAFFFGILEGWARSRRKRID
jgi:hypothetical protein